ncbi:P2 phage tail completion protein R (GpR) [Gulbenkiania indica]|uniref:p2 phage tail completion protein R (GpR) n=1 Tax=Gulbenkiania indica TaxID=375574 RepID=A0A0K6GTM6_9NEIS|nr:phage tail protein [Gulbenkiania indica]CUA82090.1 P2 phage tail completion protein R (GpR) [Gulbenkiania indica]
MNKPSACRAAIEAALPYLRKDPDRLVMFIEGGKIAASLGGPGFEYRYTLTIGLLDFNQHPDTVMIPLLQWLKTNEPAALQNPDRAKEAITFEAEILNHTTYDLRLQVTLTERVKVDISGSDITATHLPEPDLGKTWPQAERLQIFVKDDLVYDSAAV